MIPLTELRVRIVTDKGWHIAYVERRADPERPWIHLWSSGLCFSEAAASSVANRWLRVFQDTGSWNQATTEVAS